MAASTTTSRAKANRFDEDITSVYTLEMPPPEPNAYAIQVVDVLGEDERYMLDAFHQQYVAIEGRRAIAQFVDTRIGEVTANASYVMGKAMESVERIEAASSLGRLERRLQDFDNKLLDQTGRYILETNAVAYRTMHEDMRRTVYKPPPPPPEPPRRKRKGVIPGFIEFLFGEA